VQEAWLRWNRIESSTIDNPAAWLTTVTTRLALDRVRSIERRREDYVGPWLPEPVLLDSDASADAVLAESVSMAMLVLLETLTPDERAVFVLREVFGLPVTEVAAALGRSEAAVRQTAHRAREHVEARRPRFDTDRRAQREATERFLAAAAGGDVEALLAVLAPDVVLVTDGGGKAKAALRPIAGADKVARFVAAVSAEGLENPDLRVALADVNGAPAIVGWEGTDPFMSMSIEVDEDGRIQQVLLVRNPDKLRGIAPAPEQPF
jgi:RNA polymerase sigma-70 factor (ECF subfamily)